ncbi:MAG: hypothetical protein KZQ73_01150 [Candidatus Thiodiazotropha sp. (ex Semelilucina semeliformis)]|nr:hypothetical protein [Candidatus Thiodiazotropha sp. (ex Semelilucina semeliformis)]
MNTNEILNDLREVLRLGGVSCKDGDIEIEDLGSPHQPPKTIPEGKMAVYSFFYNGKALKVGKAGPKSKARYTSQHYSAGSAPSTLAASLENKPEAIGLTKSEISDSKEWLKQNTQRINFIINNRLGVDVLNLVEAFLIAKLSPVYEGFDRQKKH